MSVLSGLEIHNQIQQGNIEISPYNPKQLNPNSCNLRLANELMVYDLGDDDDFIGVLDMKKNNAVKHLTIPPEGILLQPNTLYLARTEEYTKTDKFVPMLEGRSSVGRLGLFVHVTAGFGDVGFAGYWTLEMYCIHPIRIYAGTEICQIYYHAIEGEYEKYTGGKYDNNTGIQASLLYKDFEKQGKWIFKDDADCNWFDECSACGFTVPNETGYPSDLFNCPECNAEMVNANGRDFEVKK